MVSASQLPDGFRLDPWQVEPSRGAVTGPDGLSRHLEPKVMEVLVILARTPHTLVTRDQLLDAVWPGQPGADQLLTRAISELRRALDDRRNHPVYIETVPKRGYRLIGEIRPLDVGAAPAPAARSWRAVPAFRYGPAVVTVAMLVIAAVWFARGGDDPPENATHPAARFDAPSSSIAVLPFTNLSGDPRNDYFSDGLSEEIRNLLAEVPGLKVIGRTSSFSFRDTAQGPQAVGRALGVGAILEGSVRQSKSRVRINARLIDVRDGSDVWSASYDRTLSDVFELQDEVASAIIDALRIQIGSYPARGRPTDITDAYALFLRARRALHDNDVQTAETALRESVTLDPGFGEAYELLAHTYWMDYLPETEATLRKLVEDSAGKALALDPGLDFARALYLEGDPGNPVADVIDAYGRAASRHPNRPEILRTLSWELAIAGYLSEALTVTERFVQLDPLAPMAHARHAAVLSALGRDEEAMASAAVAERLSPDGLKWVIGEAHLIRGNDAAAVAYFEADVGTGGGDTTWVGELVAAARAAGPAALDERIAAVLANTPEADIALRRFQLNCLYLVLGYLDRYFEIILAEAASQPRDLEDYVWWGTLYRQWGFTEHPRYPEVARLMGFTMAWEQRGPPDFCEAVSGAWVCR